MSSHAFRPAFSKRDVTMTLLVELVTIHRLIVPSIVENADVPVCLEAASACMLCSRVRSTAVLENVLWVQRMARASFSRTCLRPG